MAKKLGWFVLAGVICCAAGVSRAYAQNPGSSTFEDDLKKQFKVSKVDSDSNGLVVTEAGTVLVIKKGGIRAYPPADNVVLPNTYKDGSVHAPSSMIKKVWNFKDRGQGADNSRLLPLEEKVYVTQLRADVKNDKVTLSLIECDSCNNVQQASNFKAQIIFQFPKGYLSGGADAGQAADMISQVLVPDQGGDQGSGRQGGDQASGQQGNGGGQQQQAAPEPPKETQTIEKGQTEDQVVGILGKPDKIVNLGAKKLYIYKDMKITFIGGKVSDVS
jgi:hypothetical protein